MKPITAREALNQVSYVFLLAFIIRLTLNLAEWIALILAAMVVYVVLYQMPKAKREQGKNKKNDRPTTKPGWSRTTTAARPE